MVYVGLEKTYSDIEAQVKNTVFLKITISFNTALVYLLRHPEYGFPLQPLSHTHRPLTQCALRPHVTLSHASGGDGPENNLCQLLCSFSTLQFIKPDGG